MMRLIPHVTEKTLPQAASQVYTFITEGAFSATEIRGQLLTRFGLHPTEIRIARRAAKKRFASGRHVRRKAMSTVAYVRLPKDETVKAFTPQKKAQA